MIRASGLPPGWATARLEDLFATITDGDHQPPPQSQTGVPFVVIGDIRNGSINLSDARFVKTAYYDSLPDQKKPARGDLLYTVTGSFGIPVVVGSDEHFCVQRHIAILKPAHAANARYIGLALSTNAALQQATELATGTAQKTVGLARLRSMTVPLAPTEEQQRIVDTLDSLLSCLDAAVANLERAQAKLKAYRASVLKAAVEGRLVPTEAELARKESRSYEPADVLFQRILKERRRCWEEAELAKLKAAGKAQRDDKRKAKYEEPECLDSSTLPRLPDGWCWAPASALYWDAGYGTSVKCVEDGSGPAVLRIPNIVEGRVDLEDLKFAVDDAALRPNDRVQPGDFLFIRTNGSRSLIGKGALVLQDNASPLFFASYLIRLRLVTVDSCDRWFALAWSGPQVREQVLRVAASSAGQHNVSLSAASSFAIPLPPAAEQARIVAEFERLDTGTAVIDHEIAAGEKRCSRLRQAILRWAFEGRLVNQDPTDEPADALLTRIRAKRAEAALAKAKQKPSRRLKVAS